MSHIRSNVVAYVALFFALGGTAWATHEEILSSDIVNGEVKTPDLDGNAVTSPKVDNNSLTGLDISEGTLGLVPEARWGGTGRSVEFAGGCNPEAVFFVTCKFVTTELGDTRVLMFGRVGVLAEPSRSNGVGNCRIATSRGHVPSQAHVVGKGGEIHHVTLVGVVSQVGPGEVDYGIECNETDGGIEYTDMSISLVALSSES